MNRKVCQAVILMAGTGSRLRDQGRHLLKPLIPLHGRPLISYTFDSLVAAGIEEVIAVIGFESELLVAGVKPLVPPAIKIQFVNNLNWHKQNGISVLVAASYVSDSFVLMMGDHIFAPAVVALVVEKADMTRANVAIDRNVDAIFDLDDAMKVQTQSDQVIAIGKDLSEWDAIDTGLFVCSTQIFDYVERVVHDGDCSLADGVRLMAKDGKVRAIDIGDAWWQDIDTPSMLEEAERKATQLR